MSLSYAKFSRSLILTVTLTTAYSKDLATRRAHILFLVMCGIIVVLCSEVRAQLAPSTINLTPATDIQTFKKSMFCDPGPRIQSGHLIVQLCGAQQGFGIAYIADSRELLGSTFLFNIKTQPSTVQELWKLFFYEKGKPPRNEQQNPEYSLTNQHNSSQPPVATPIRDGIKLVWSNLSVNTPGIPTDHSTRVDVTVVVNLSSSNSIRAFIDVDVDSNILTLSEVSFPRIRYIKQDNIVSPSLVVPTSSSGTRILKPWAGKLPAPGRSRGLRYPGKDWTMQWVAADFEVDSDIFLAVEDTKANTKVLRLCNEGPKGDVDSQCNFGTTDPLLGRYGVGIDIGFFPHNIGQPGNDFSSAKQPVIIALQDGGWYEHAQRYANFVNDKTPFTRRGLIAQQSHYPESLLCSSYISAHSEPGSLWSLTNDETKDRFGKEIGVFWHFTQWGKSQLNLLDNNTRFGRRDRQNNDTPFFEYTPSADFIEDEMELQHPSLVVHKMIEGKALDGVTGVALYVDPADLDLNNADLSGIPDPTSDNPLPLVCEHPWEQFGISDLGSIARLNADGSVSIDKQNVTPPINVPTDCSYNIPRSMGEFGPQSNNLKICPGSQPWQAIFNKTLIDSWLIGDTQETYPTLDGLYLDVIAASRPQLCFDSSHSHPPGGGHYWAEGYRQLINNSRQALFDAGIEKPVIYTESFAEAYVDVVDGFYTVEALDTYYPLPLVQAVYSGYTQFMGVETTTHEDVDSPAAVTIKQGLHLSWGGMPGGVKNPIDLDHDRFDASYMRYLVKLARTYKTLRNWLALGQMQKPPLVRARYVANQSELPLLPHLDSEYTVPREVIRTQSASEQSTLLNYPAVSVTQWSHGQWSHGGKGPDGILVVNLSPKDVQINTTIQLPRNTNSYKVYRIGDPDEKPVIEHTGNSVNLNEISLELKRHDIYFIAINQQYLLPPFHNLVPGISVSCNDYLGTSQKY